MYGPKDADAQKMFEGLQAQVRAQYRRTAWRDRVWAGLFGMLVAPLPVYLMAIPVFRLTGLEISLDLQVTGSGELGGRVGIAGIHWGRFLLNWLAVALLLARWIHPKLGALRMKRLWGN
ncbi:MAG: hypothetical protein RL318_2932 [Fibrobacterota bacterium]